MVLQKKTTLYKYLYFIDFNYYELFEKHIIGEDYYKSADGPIPYHFDDIINELKTEGLIKERRKNYYVISNTNVQSELDTMNCLIKLSILNSDEKRVLNETLRKLNKIEINSYSKMDMPYKAAELNEKLDYELVFYRDDFMSVQNTNMYP